MTTLAQALPTRSGRTRPAPAERRLFRPTIEIEQVRASWTTVEQLFKAAQARDPDAILLAYAEEALIDHPLLGSLSRADYAAALTAFLQETPDYELTFQINHAGIDHAEAEWTLSYVFHATGRSIVTKGETAFRLSGLRIIHQRDDFDRRDWSRQALGLSGFVLSFVPGWRAFLERELRRSLSLGERADG
jgi:hypothetical protein